MYILITGGLGYVGTHLTIRLIEKGFNVLIVDNLVNSQINNLSNIQKIVKIKESSTRLIFYNFDIGNTSALRKVFKSFKILFVVHLAGYKSVPESIVKPIEYYENNFINSIKLIKIMEEFECYKILFSSSASVYCANELAPFKEDSLIGPINPYSESKFYTENLLRNQRKTNKNWSIGILRYFNPVGSHSSGLIGDNPIGRVNNLMPLICKAANKEIESIKVFGNDYETPDGSCIRDFIHIEDLISGHEKLITLMINSKETALTLNLGTGKGISVLEVIDTFRKVNRVDFPIIFDERRAGDIASSFADVSLSKKVLSWEAKYNLEEMCRDSWNFAKK